MLDQLPVELVLYLLEGGFLDFKDRDALLAVFPGALPLYRLFLKRRYQNRAQALRGMSYFSTPISTFVVKERLTLVEKPLGGLLGTADYPFPYFVREDHPTTRRCIHNGGDLWVASIAAGTNIQWLEIQVAGVAIIPGSRIYYRTTPGKRLHKYVCPDSSISKGIPIIGMYFTSLQLVCNPGGHVDRRVDLFHHLDTTPRNEMAEAPFRIPAHGPQWIGVEKDPYYRVSPGGNFGADPI